jgi:hypothetical protein
MAKGKPNAKNSSPSSVRLSEKREESSIKPSKNLNNAGVFLDFIPATRFSKSLRRLLLCYLKHELSTGIEDCFDDMIRDLEIVFNVLDEVEKEIDKTGSNEQ